MNTLRHLCISLAAAAVVTGTLVPAAQAGLNQDAKYWNQLMKLMTPVELPSMTDHRAFMLPGGIVLATHFDDMDFSEAKNLNWIALGLPGTFCQSDLDRIQTANGGGFTHFHSMKNDTHGGEDGEKGVWFVHVGVRDFETAWGKVTQSAVDHGFMPTPPPIC